MSKIYEQAWGILEKLRDAPDQRLPVSTLQEDALRHLSDYGLIAFLGRDADHGEEVVLTPQGVYALGSATQKPDT